MTNMFVVFNHLSQQETETALRFIAERRDADQVTAQERRELDSVESILKEDANVEESILSKDELRQLRLHLHNSTHDMFGHFFGLELEAQQ